MKQELLNAIEHALQNRWEESHSIVQQHEDMTAAWIHAVLHKIEGDESNSLYWYRRAGRLEHFPDEPKAELMQIRKSLDGNV